MSARPDGPPTEAAGRAGEGTALRWRWLGEVGSTNAEAAALAREGAPAGTVVVAEAQTEGRGRLGRAWWSPPGDNLYLSYLHRVRLAPDRLGGLTLDVGLAVSEALDELGLPAGLKWPNDIIVRGRKLGGLLAELHTGIQGGDAVVVGVGLDLNTCAFPSELASVATSYALETGLTLSVRRAAHVVAAHLARRFRAFEARGGADVAGYLERWVLAGAPVRAGDVVGRATRVEADGGLVLVADDGHEVRVTSGEVTSLSGWSARGGAA